MHAQSIHIELSIAKRGEGSLRLSGDSLQRMGDSEIERSLVEMNVATQYEKQEFGTYRNFANENFVGSELANAIYVASPQPIESVP